MKKYSNHPMQGDLFQSVISAYLSAPCGALSNEDLYQMAGKGYDLETKTAIGQSGEMRNPVKQRIRWYQQELKNMGILSRIDRGQWRLSDEMGTELQESDANVKEIAFSTDLGIAIWARHESVFPKLNEPINLYISSFPYPLRKPRAYGNPKSKDYIDFVLKALEPIIRNLADDASIILNLSNDIFEPKSPARSLYVQYLTIALHENFGLDFMGQIPWVNYSKPPGPTYWACVQRIHLSSCFEHILWFCKDARLVNADNRRVLETHTQKHLAFLEAGGENRNAEYGDGAYRLRAGKSFSKVTTGKIPRNVFERGHSCADTIAYRKAADGLNLPKHGAMFPTDLPEFFIRYLTNPGQLVADQFGGTGKTALAAEKLGRRWIITEKIYQYLRGGAELFRNCKGFSLG